MFECVYEEEVSLPRSTFAIAGAIPGE